MHKIHKYALLLVFPSLLAGCSGVDHASYPFKTSGQNTALGAWEFVQTKMNSNIMPLYQIQDVQPKNMLFVGKKHGCHCRIQIKMVTFIWPKPVKLAHRNFQK